MAAAHGRATGKLVTSTTTVRGFASWTRRTNSSCPGGNVIAFRSTASLPSLGDVTTSQPALPSGWLPTHTTATFCRRASSMAASLMSPTQLTPTELDPGGPGFANRSMPSRGETA